MTKKTAQSPKLPEYVVEQGGKWYVRRFFPTGRRDAKGRVIYLQVKRRCEVHTAEAAKEISDFIEAEYQGTLPKPVAQQTIGQFLEYYLAAKKLSIRRRTYEGLVGYFHRYVERTAFASIPLVEVRPSHVQAFYTSLALTPSVAHKLHKFLSSAFKQAVAWEDLPRNPCTGLLLPKLPDAQINALDPKQAKRFIAECRKTDKDIVFEFALETGARPGEYLALRWSDVDLDKCLVHIRRAFAAGLEGGGFEYREPKTRGSVRTLQISTELRDRLRVQKQIVEEMAARCRQHIREPILKMRLSKGRNYQSRKRSRQAARATLSNLAAHDLVFPSEVGLPLSINNLNRRRFKAIIADIGLDPDEYSLYSLRHTAATLSLVAGVNLKAVAEKLGHTGVEVLLSTYAHVLPNMKQEASDKLAAVLY